MVFFSGRSLNDNEIFNNIRALLEALLNFLEKMPTENTLTRRYARPPPKGRNVI